MLAMGTLQGRSSNAHYGHYRWIDKQRMNRTDPHRIAPDYVAFVSRYPDEPRNCLNDCCETKNGHIDSTSGFLNNSLGLWSDGAPLSPKNQYGTKSNRFEHDDCNVCSLLHSSFRFVTNRQRRNNQTKQTAVGRGRWRW